MCVWGGGGGLFVSLSVCVYEREREEGGAPSSIVVASKRKKNEGKGVEWGGWAARGRGR